MIKHIANKTFCLFLIVTATFQIVDGQNINDSSDFIIYDYSFEFKDGLYPTFYDFRKNSPIPYHQLISPVYNDSFYENLDKAISISYYDNNGNVCETAKKFLWGYAKNGKPYVQWSNKFNLIPYLGTISHFFTTIMVTRYSSGGGFPYSSFYEPINNSYTTEEIVMFFINMQNGNITPYNSKTMSEQISNDPELFDQFMKLKKRKRENSIMQYIQLYNKKHPLYFNK